MVRSLLAGGLVTLTLAIPVQAQFSREFEEAAKLRDEGAAYKLIQRQSGRAFQYGRRLAMRLASQGDVELQGRFAFLCNLFHKVTKSRVLEKMGEFFRGVGTEGVANARALENKLNLKFSKYQEGMGGNKEAWDEATAYYAQVAKDCTEFGDKFLASNGWHMVYTLQKKPIKGAKVNMEAVYGAAEAFVKARTAWDLCFDRFWSEVSRDYKHLKKLKDSGRSWDEMSSDKPFKGPQLAYEKGSKWIRIDGKFKVWKSWDDGVSPFSSSRTIMWPMAFMSGILGGGQGRGIGLLRGYEPKLQILRTKASSYVLDLDGDGKEGKGDERIKLGGKPRLVQFPLTMGDVQTKGALYFWMPGTQEEISGLPINLAPTPNVARIYYRGATAIEVVHNGEKLTFIDENSNGALGASRGYTAKRHLPYQVVCPDSMILPGQKKPIPFSDFIKLKDGYYKFKFSGYTAKLRKLDMEKTPLGSLRMVFKGPKSAMPKHLIVGEVSVFLGAQFDLVAFPKGVQVPAGHYRILSGFLCSGKKARARTGVIATGKSEVIEVKPGQETVVKIGAPYKFDFKYTLGGGITVDGLSVKILGASGEAYMDVWGEPPSPTVYLRTDTKGRGRKVGEMYRPDDTKELDNYFRVKNQADTDFRLMDAFFSPMDLLVKRPRGSVQVMLKQSRHKVFKKIESDWK